MTSKFDKPYLETNTFDSIKVGNLFNLASNFDLEGLRRSTLVDKIPLNIVNSNNENLIHVTIRTVSSNVNEDKRLKIIDFLVSKGAHPDLKNDQGLSPLHYACEKQFKNIINKLLEYGSDPNSKDNFGRTPIHYLLSGIISEWTNKENKPLFYASRKGKSKDHNEKILKLKNIIYKLLQEKNLEGQINTFLSGVDLEALGIEKPPLDIEYDVSSNYNLKDLQEKQKTRIYEIKEQLDNIFEFNIDNILEIKDGTPKIDVNNFIKKKINNEKEELINEINNYTEYFKQKINNDCLKIQTLEDLYFKKDVRGRLVDKDVSEYIIPNTISPFLPYINLTDNYFVSNKETNIIYTKLPDNYLRDLSSKKELEILIRLFNFSYKNDGVADADLGLYNIISEGKSVQSIYNELLRINQVPSTNNKEKLSSLILLGIVTFYYNPGELLNILQIPQLNNFFNTGNPNDKYNECVFLRERLEYMIKKGNFPEFVFYVFYYLIDKDVINNNVLPSIPPNPPIHNHKRLFTSCLYLVKIMMNKRLGININLLEMSQYEREDLLEENEDKQYLNVGTTNDILIKPLIKLTEQYKQIINRRENIEIIDTDNNAKIFGDEKHKIYFTKRYEWIMPSLKEILGYHYLIDELSDIDLNQGIYVKRILGCEFISKAPTEKLNDTVSHETPEYLAGDNQKCYINDLNLKEQQKRILCSYFNIYKNILYRGEFPLLKIFDIEDDSKFNKYFNKVVPYHLKNIKLLDYLRNVQSKINLGNNLKFGVNLSSFDKNINSLSIYNYILIRLNTRGDVLQVPHFYFYNIDNDDNYSQILSYSDSGVKDKEEIDDIETDIEKEYLKPKINTEKLRISKNDLPDSLKSSLGLKLLLQLTIMKSLSFNDGIFKLAGEILAEAGFIAESKDYEETKVDILNKLYKEICNEILERQLNLIAIEKLGNIQGMTDISKEISENITFLKSTDLKFSVTQEPKQISIFPIIKENEKYEESLPELYFSNDYTSDEFVEKLYEIKYEDGIIESLINNGCNPFLVDNLQQSCIHLLSTNYLYKPYNILKNIGIDFRQKDENGYDFKEKIKKELEYHKSFINVNKENFRDIVNDLVEPFYNNIKHKIDKTNLSGFNHLRYTRLALEMTAYYLLANVDLIGKLPSKIYPNDLVLAKHLVKPKTKTQKSRKFDYTPDYDNLVDKHLDFVEETFIDSPGVFLDEFENILRTNKLINNLDDINLNSDDCVKYFINEKINSVKQVKKINTIINLVSREVLGTQVIYLLTNLLNAHLKMKFVKLDDSDRVRIIEEIINKIQILETEENVNSLLNIILDSGLEKVVKSNINIYEDEIELVDKPDYTIRDYVEEISAGLKLIPEYFEENDKLLSEVLPNFLTEYLELYLPEVLRSMRCIVENILKWKINYEKLKKLN